MANPLPWLRSGCASSLRATSMKVVFAMACCITVLPALGGTAFAYNRDNAVAYADNWATSTNGNYPVYPEDCTNFVSQALRGGGYPFVGTPQWWNSGDDTQWWGDWGPFGYWFKTNSWAGAVNQYNFQMAHYPGGWLEETVNPGNSDYWANYDNVNMIGGDVLFFDLTGSGIDHAAFQVWSGYSPIGSAYYGAPWYGDLSDQHSPGQLHNTWSHLPTNGNWATTTIYEVHIDDRN